MNLLPMEEKKMRNKVCTTIFRQLYLLYFNCCSKNCLYKYINTKRENYTNLPWGLCKCIPSPLYFLTQQ